MSRGYRRIDDMQWVEIITAIVRIGGRTYIANFGYVKYETCEEKKMAKRDPRTKPELTWLHQRKLGDEMKSSCVRNGFLALAAVLIFVSLGFTASAHAAVKEGEDYLVVAEPIPNMEKTVFKVFSYDCQFSYSFDKSVTHIVAGALGKDGIKFTVWHLKNKGKYGAQASELFASLITQDQKAGLGLFDDKASFKKAKMAYYKAYLDDRERWGSGADAFVKTGLDAAGITSAEFQQLLKDPATQARLKDWEGAIEIAKLQGVPAFVVKGKYLLYTKNLRSIDGMVATIEELMAK